MLLEDSKEDTWILCFGRWKKDTWWNMKGWLWRVIRDTCEINVVFSYVCESLALEVAWISKER